MANVSFKRGLSTALSNVAVEDGVFYLTTDTNRLYVGQGSKLAELNQSVTTYATWAAMEASAPKQEGQFYYAIQENVLACYLPELNKWQQINPDHNDNDDTYVSSLSVGSADKSETGKLKYTITVGQKTKHQGKAETTVTPNITGKLEISSEDLDAITPDITVGVASNAIAGNDNGFVLKTTGNGADADTNIAIVGGNNVNISRSGNGKTITIKSTDTNTTYNLLSNAGDAKITLHGSDNADRTVSFVGAQQIEVSGANEREIAIKHKNSTLTAGNYNSSTKITNNKFTVPSFTVDQQGHITSASTNELTIPASHDTKTSITSVSAGNDGRIGITYAQDNAEQTVYSNADLYYKIIVDGTTETTIKNQGSLGKFYSSDKVDELIRQAAANMNAMTYKGVVASDTFATTVAGAQKGDTYKANGEIVIGSQTAKTGDLIIYKGDDLADGSAPANTDFDVISSGDEIDSQFALSGSNNKIVLTNTTKDNTPAGSVSVSGTDGILAEVTGNALSIKHTNAVSAGSVGESSNISPAAGKSFKIPSISYDAQGHIKSANNITVTLPKDTTYSLGTAAGDAKYDAYINLTPATGSGAAVTSAKFKAGANIAITGSGSNISVAHSGPGDATGNVIGNNTKTALDYGNTFIVPKITKDANGHIVNTEDVVLTLPEAVAIPKINYKGETGLSNNRVTMSSSLTVDTATYTYSPSIGSSTLTLSTNGHAITMDLEWGSF